MMSNRVFLVTGGTGFIGSVLVRRLVSREENVHLLTRHDSNFWRVRDLVPRLRCHHSDLSDIGSLKKIFRRVKPNVIYHLATHGAYAHQNDADRIIRTNILGTWNLLRAAAHTGYELFVNTGSSSEYGFKRFPMRETDILEPASYYAAAKCSQTLLCLHIARNEKRPIVTLRPFSVYGPYEDPTRFVPTLMKAIYQGTRMDLVSPKTARDQIYVEDVVDAYLLIDRLKKYAGEIFNIGTGIQSTIRKVVDITVRVTGKKAKFRWGHMRNRSWDTTYWVADVSKARRDLHWKPRIDLKTGLGLTWDWFKKNNRLYGKIREAP